MQRAAIIPHGYRDRPGSRLCSGMSLEGWVRFGPTRLSRCDHGLARVDTGYEALTRHWRNAWGSCASCWTRRCFTRRWQLRVLSLCAGDGRDVLPVLARWQAHKEIHGWLVELQSDLADRARDEAHSVSLRQLEVIRGDAAEPTEHTGAIPADLIVACGIFGRSRTPACSAWSSRCRRCAPRARTWSGHGIGGILTSRPRSGSGLRLPDSTSMHSARRGQAATPSVATRWSGHPAGSLSPIRCSRSFADRKSAPTLACANVSGMSLDDVALSRLGCFSNHTTGFENPAGRLNKAPGPAHLMTEMAARGATVEALESLYRADLPRFVRAATAIVGDEGAGRDAVQDAFVKAVRKRTGYNGAAPLETWVWRIVINEALALRRSRASEFEKALESTTTPSTNHVPERHRRACLGRRPSRTPAPCCLSPVLRGSRLSVHRSRARGRGRNSLGHARHGARCATALMPGGSAMTDVELGVADSFERVFPVPTVVADWDDVLDRAGARSGTPTRPPSRWRVVAVAAVILVGAAFWSRRRSAWAVASLI